MNVSDDSNYSTNTESGHGTAAFNRFIWIAIQRPVDGDGYLMQGSLVATPENDLIIDTPAVTVNGDWDLPTSWNIVNGSYTYSMLVIPTYDAAATYTVASTDLVYQANKIYKCLAASTTGQDPISNPGVWEEITQVEAEAFTKYYSKGDISQTCITENTISYETTLVDSEGATDIAIDNDCDLVTIGDNSNYTTNDENGHAEAHFTDYVRISITKPGGDIWVLGSLTGDDVAITPPSAGSHSYGWDMDDADNDGMYIMTICAFPTWQADIHYNSFTASQKVIVYYDGLLWQALTANLNSTPVEGADWTKYTGDGSETRYCFTTHVTILCRTIDPCYQDAITRLHCEQGACSKDFCDNPLAIKAMKMRLLKDDITYNVCKKNWAQVEKLINLGLTICGC